MGHPVTKVSEVHVTGPLEPFAGDVKAGLLAAGYSPLTTANLLRLTKHLSRWLKASGLKAGDLTRTQLDNYVEARQAAGYKLWSSPGSLTPLMRVFVRVGVPCPEPVPAALSAEDAVLASFARYLFAERGLARPTVEAYVARARRFLARVGGSGSIVGLTPQDVVEAVLDESATVTVGSAQYFVAALRSFLRFCFLERSIDVDLSAAALAVTGRRRALLPRGVSPAEIQALLSSCDRQDSEGRRDYAVLVSLTRLGLRASEVAGLQLDDIDWRAGEVLVRGKNRREDRLPLPADMGEAIVGYLRDGRPSTTRREVFLRLIAPIAPLRRGGVSCIVRRACVRAGIPEIGAHRLRHTVACEMVAAGVPLIEIGQVLRHRSVASTAIYARVDLAELRKVAQPWPGATGR